MARLSKAKSRKTNKNAHNGTKPSHFSMQEEARNTEGRNSWRSNTQLRHQAVQFISAGSLEPAQETITRPSPEGVIQNEAIHTVESATPMTNNTSHLQLCPSPAREEATVTVNKVLPTRPLSPAPQDSSEDEIVFRGRRSRPRRFDEGRTDRSQLPTSSTDLSPDPAPFVALKEHSPGWIQLDDSGVISPRISDEDAILADYIAHMDDDTVPDGDSIEEESIENDVTSAARSHDLRCHKNGIIDIDHYDISPAEELEDATYSNEPGLSASARTKPDRDIFASATAFDDALEQDPYYGLDVMDFNRSSLKKKKKNQLFTYGDFDSELEDELINAWKSDRSKKKLKKKEREELRAQGLLGRRKNDPDLKTRYADGIGIEELRHEIRLFLLSPKNSLSLPPMTKHRRMLIHDMAHALRLTSQSRGKGSSRFPILSKTSRTPKYTHTTILQVDRLFSKEKFSSRVLNGWDKTKGRSAKTKSVHGNVSYMDGDVVGASAPEIGVENKGRAMLEKMGWSTGTALGATNNKGILLPVAHVVKNSKAGLG
ncbi:putative R3H and G-patch domain protein [Aspergillus undulatus]|uniref:putative R3H and G-patch domain protein n=1 Tax=Aspergillus undulatus TaxID=1810928 RepID=UPI003CCDA327